MTVVDPVVGWLAIARRLSERRCDFLGIPYHGRLARKVSISEDWARKLVAREAVQVRKLGPARNAPVVVAAADIDELAAQRWRVLKAATSDRAIPVPPPTAPVV